MSNFGDRLRKLREINGLTLKDLSKIINIPAVMLRDWENGERVLTVSKIIKLAQYFKVSTDYLLGL